MNGRQPSIIEIWIEGFAPLVLDAFSIYLVTNTTTTSFVETLNGTTQPLLFVAISTGALTFAMNMFMMPYIRQFVNETGVGDAPLFRSVWLFICATAVTQHTATTGIMTFTIVTFIPYIYIRVRHQLAACAAVYALVFLLFVVRNSVLSPKRQQPHVNQTDVYNIISHTCVFILSSLYHIAWFETHKYTSDPDSQIPVRSYFLFPYRNSTIPLAAFRTVVVVLCVLSGNGGLSDETTPGVHFMRILFLLSAISTYTAWIHCQHTHKHTLHTVLSTSVFVSAFGSLVSNIQQTLFAWAVFYIVILIDIFNNTTARSRKTHKS